MSLRTTVPFAFAMLAAVALPTLPASASGPAPATPVREILLDARKKGAAPAAEVARALSPASPRAIGELRRLLSDEDAFVRGTAVSVLAALDDHPVQALLRLLHDDDRGVRRAAEEALGDAGPAAVEPVGEFFLAESCLSEAKRTAARVLGRIGDPAGIPYLTAVLVKYRSGGFAQSVGMRALTEMGSPEAVRQVFQLITYPELKEQAYFALMSMETGRLLRSVERLLDEPSDDLGARFFYAAQLNEVAGTEVAAPVVARFAARVAKSPGEPDAARKKAAILASLFSRPRADAEYFRPPLTPERLAAMFREEEDPDEQRKRNEEARERIREERRKAEESTRSSMWEKLGERR